MCIRDSSIHSGDREFRVPEDYPLNAASSRIDDEGNKYIRVKGVRWFTNLDYNERHEDLILFKNYNSEEYPTYDNYNACLLYTSDAADERSSVDLGGRRIIKKKKKTRDTSEIHIT